MKGNAQPIMPENDSSRLEQYILGRMTEEERDEIATKVFEDDHTFDALRDVEAALHDRFARGELDAPTREAYLRYVAESGSAHRVRFARALQARAKRRAVPGQWLAVAACVVAMTGSAIWFTRSARDETRKAETPAALQLPVATFVIPPGVLRGEESGLVIRVPEGAQNIHLEFALDRPWPGGPFRLEIRRAGAPPVTQNGDAPGGVRGIAVEFKPEIGRYTATLMHGATGHIDDYVFAVE